jgi:hypothetical protein
MGIDELFSLCGDEDTGVGLHCRTCDRGGAPVAYLCPQGTRNPWARDADVAEARGIVSLLAVGRTHARMVHDLHVWVDV